MLPMTEQIAKHPDDYRCDKVCPCLDNIVNKFCEIVFAEPPQTARHNFDNISPQGYEHEPTLNSVIIRKSRNKQRRPSRKKSALWQFIGPKYPSDSESQNSDNSQNSSESQTSESKSPLINPNTSIKNPNESASEEDYLLV